MTTRYTNLFKIIILQISVFVMFEEEKCEKPSTPFYGHSQLHEKDKCVWSKISWSVVNWIGK